MNAAGWSSALRAPWQQRRNQGSLWIWVAIATLAALVPGILAFSARDPLRAVALSLLGVGGVVLVAGWVDFVNSLLVQNHPNAAHLVPGHVRTLRRLMLAVGAGLTGIAGVAGCAFGQGLTVAAAAVLALLAMAWVVGRPALAASGWLFGLAFAMWGGLPSVRAHVFMVIEVAHQYSGPLSVGAAILLWAATQSTLHRLLREGDERHRRRYDIRMKWMQSLGAGRSDQGYCIGSSGTPGKWWRELTNLPYRVWLEQRCARREGDVLGRGLLGLGPMLNWAGQLGTVVLPGSCLAALFFGVFWLTGVLRNADGSLDVEGLSVMTFGLAFGVMPMVANLGLTAFNRLQATRREQALMVLLPGMPRGRALNRALARRLLTQFFVTWSLGLLLCGGLALPTMRRFEMIVILAMACLPLGALLLRDWARNSLPQPSRSATTALVPLMACSGAIALHYVLGIGALPCALGFAAITLVALAWRWRIVDTAPGAFPVGRLA